MNFEFINRFFSEEYFEKGITYLNLKYLISKIEEYFLEYKKNIHTIPKYPKSPDFNNIPLNNLEDKFKEYFKLREIYEDSLIQKNKLEHSYKVEYETYQKEICYLIKNTYAPQYSEDFQNFVWSKISKRNPSYLIKAKLFQKEINDFEKK